MNRVNEEQSFIFFFGFLFEDNKNNRPAEHY